MTHKIILLLLIAVIAFAQPHPRIGRQQGKMSGAYHTVEAEELQAMKKGGPFQEVERVARFFYTSKTEKQLGDILSVEKQVVSGMNFKITFAAEAGSAETVIMTIFFQPWTKTIEIVSIMPAIDGVTDETGRLLPNVDQPTIN